MTTVMITGAGAIIGYGLIRSLKDARPELRIVGSDIYPDAVGQIWCDAFERAPLTASPHYLDWLFSTVEKHDVDLVIPGIEQDVHRLSDAEDQLAAFKCKFALNTRSLIQLSRDKWLMHEALLSLGDPSRIPSYLSGDYRTLSQKLGTPFILKPRRGYASKGLVRVRDQSDFSPVAHDLGENLMAQPLVGSDDEEFTVAGFGDGQGRMCASICLQRMLAKDGSTAKAWVRNDTGLEETAARLCAHFKPVGPTNLQFRRDEGDWKLLEINPRVSSTTSIRAAFGYNEALMSLDYYLDGRLPTQPTIKSGFAMRFIEDCIIYDRDHF